MNVPHTASRIDRLEEVRGLIAQFSGADAVAADAARSRQEQLTKPAGALGRLEEIAVWLAAWQRRHPPRLDRALALVFAGNHGVVRRGVSAFPGDVTAQMVANFADGGAAINQLCAEFGADLRVIDLDLDVPTEDFTIAPAMTEPDCAAAFNTGLAAVPVGIDVLLVGEMGIGNTTAAAALCAALFGGMAADWTGPGTGLDQAGVRRKAEVIAEALAFHGSALSDPLEALRCVGGRELAAMAGAMLGARLAHVPVLLDGFVAGAAAGVLHRVEPEALGHCLAGHVSAEPGHRRLLAALDKEALLDLGMRLGEASGAAVALAVLRAAVATHNGMATFAEAGVSAKS